MEVLTKLERVIHDSPSGGSWVIRIKETRRDSSAQNVECYAFEEVFPVKFPLKVLLSIKIVFTIF